MSNPNFEQYWAARQAEKAAELAAKYSTVKQAFDGLRSKEEIKLLAGVIHPGQQVFCFEMIGSSQVAATDGLPYWADRKPYDTVRAGTVHYFHRSTLKEGDTVEYDGRKWEVLMNYYSRGSAESLAYQCIWLLEIGVNLDITI